MSHRVEERTPPAGAAAGQTPPARAAAGQTPPARAAAGQTPPARAAAGQTPPDPAQMSTGELISELTATTSQLVRDEIHLAVAELKDKGKHAGIGVGMFGAAGIVALFGGGALVATAIGALATAMDVWAAALIVALVLFTMAGVLALLGKKQVSAATPPMPEEAMDGLREDIATVKEGIKR